MQFRFSSISENEEWFRDKTQTISDAWAWKVIHWYFAGIFPSLSINTESLMPNRLSPLTE